MGMHQSFTRLRQSVVAITPWIVLAVFLTALDIHFISAKVSDIGLHYSLQASQGVVDGLPHWRIYQSRIFGPYVIHGIERLFNLSATMAYLAFIASASFATKLIVIRFGLGYTRNIILTLLMLVTGSLLFAMLLSNPWLYPWDMGGLLLSTLFVVMALRGAYWPWFIPLAAVAFLNRESGFFICVWLFVQGFLGYGEKTGRKPPHTGMMAAAVVVALCGFAGIDWLRDHLLIREIGPELWGATPEGTSWFHWKLIDNFEMFMRNFTSDTLKLPLIFYLFPLAGIVMAAAIGARSYPAYTALCVAFIINLIFIFMFSVMEEPRAMIETIPFFSIFFIYYFAAGAGGGNVRGGNQ